MAGTTTLELTGFEELKKALDPRAFERRLRREVKRAMVANAQIAEAEVKKDIYAGATFDPNSQRTIAIKGSSRPLVDNGDLVKSVDGQVVKWDLAVIGVLRSKQVKGEDGKTEDIKNIAVIVHEGAVIRVTDKMRAFFAAMSRKHPGKWFPLDPKTTVIVIPPRPFLESAVKKELRPRMKEHWEDAIRRALKPPSEAPRWRRLPKR